MTIEAIAITFSGIVLLVLLRVTVDSRDEVRTIRQALFGISGEPVATGLVTRVADLARSLDAHCTDERVFWAEVKEQRRDIKDEVINAATAVMASAQLELGEQIDRIRQEVHTLAERRLGPRPDSER